jgi:hypothetical protein
MLIRRCWGQSRSPISMNELVALTGSSPVCSPTPSRSTDTVCMGQYLRRLHASVHYCPSHCCHFCCQKVRVASIKGTCVTVMLLELQWAQGITLTDREDDFASSVQSPECVFFSAFNFSSFITNNCSLLPLAICTAPGHRRTKYSTSIWIRWSGHPSVNLLARRAQHRGSGKWLPCPSSGGSGVHCPQQRGSTRDAIRHD